MSRKIVVFGTGEFAHLCHYYFTHDSPWRIDAFTVDGAYLRETTFHGLPVVPFEELQTSHPSSEFGMFVALGLRKVNAFRAAKVEEAEAKGYRLVSFLSSKADVPADFVVKPNSMIMERAGLQPYVTVGKNTIIWSTTRIGFSSRIGDHCWLVCPIMGESTIVGDYTFVGLNATIAPRVQIGKSNVIGAGTLIVSDTKDGEVYKAVSSNPSRAPSHRLRGFGD